MNKTDVQLEVARLVVRAKIDKEEAKYLRDKGNIAGAVILLEKTVAAFEESLLFPDLNEPNEVSGKQLHDLAVHLADCLGMLGGNYRRLGRLDDAQKRFEYGRIYEESLWLGVMSSYNMVNAITVPIEVDGQNLMSLRPNLEKAVMVLSKQVLGDRRNDRWAWADLGQCQLLLGDEKAAYQSYSRFKDLGDIDEVASVTTVLKRFCNSVPKLIDSIEGVISFLKK